MRAAVERTFDVLLGASLVGNAISATLAIFGLTRPFSPVTVALAMILVASMWVERYSIPALRRMFPKRWAVLIEIREVALGDAWKHAPASPWRLLTAKRHRRRVKAFRVAQVAADAWKDSRALTMEARVYVAEVDTRTESGRHYRSLRRVRAK